MTTIPAYRRVYAAIKEQMKSGVYPAGSLLPVEADLEKQFSVSRTTIRRAISLLVSEGFLRPKQGKGTVILDPSTTQKLNHLTSITETLREQGHRITSKGMCITKISAPDYLAEKLELHKGDPVYQIQRVQYVDGKPIALMVNCLRASAVPNLEQYSGKFSSLYSFLEEHYRLILTTAEDRISALSADFTDSQILQVPVGTPLLFTKRTSRTEQYALEYSTIKMIADKYEYCVYLQGRR